MIEAGQYITDGTAVFLVCDIRDNAQVGDIKMSSVLRKGYIKANGALLTNASVNYPRLVTFVENNPSQTMYVYNNVNDTLTIPHYQTDSPIGTIISYMGNTVPTSYLACDGTTYNIANYQELADFINTEFGSYNYFGGDGTTTFAVPDLRGEFLRGTGTNSHTNQGSGANVGVHQDATEHIYFGFSGADNLWTAQRVLPDGSTTMHPLKRDSNVSSGIGNGLYIDKSGVNPTPGSISQYTSRPTNTSVLYCIKYTNPLIPQIKY